MNILPYLLVSSIVGPLLYFFSRRVSAITRKAVLFGMLLTSKRMDGNAAFSINDSRRSASIVYTRNGQKYIVNIPYDRGMMVKMANCQVIGYRSDDVAIDLTQQPGIPYLVSPDQLGLARVEVYNTQTGENRTFVAQQTIQVF